MTWGDDYGAARLYDGEGRAVHATSGVPVRRVWLLLRCWPPVVRYGGTAFFDSGRCDPAGLRAYCQPPRVDQED